MIYIAIDPGAKGAVVRLNVDLPRTDSGRVRIYETKEEFCELIYNCSSFGLPYKKHLFKFYIEAVHASPQMGRSSAFNFGKNYGYYIGALESNGFEYTPITPQNWQHLLKLSGKLKGVQGPARKRLLKEEAKRIYPSHKVTLQNADALLLAEFCRQFGGYTDFGDENASSK